MFPGHLALALAAKKKLPDVSLGWTMAAVMTLDLIWPILLLLGLEQVAVGSATGGFDQLTFTSYPWTHSLLMALVWSGVMWGVARWRGISKPGALWLAALVASHWVLDWISHAPDMPLFPWGGPKVGLGLWGSIPATFIVEGGLFLAGLWVYLHTTKAKDRIGSWGLGLFVLTILLLWGSTPWSPPPTSIGMLAWSSIIFEWILITWAWWIDRHRVVA